MHILVSTTCTVEHAKQYGIEIEKFEKADKGFGKKGGFELKYLNGWTPPAPVEKKSKMWLWILIAIIAIGAIIAAILMNKEPEVKVVEKEKIVTVVDTVYVQQLEDIEKKFNAAQFEKGKSELSEDRAKAAVDFIVSRGIAQERLQFEGKGSAEPIDPNNLEANRRTEFTVIE